MTNTWREQDLARIEKILKDMGKGRKTKADNTQLVAERMIDLIAMPKGMVGSFAMDDYLIIRHWLTIMVTVGLKATDGEPFLKDTAALEQNT